MEDKKLELLEKLIKEDKISLKEAMLLAEDKTYVNVPTVWRENFNDTIMHPPYRFTVNTGTYIPYKSSHLGLALSHYAGNG